MYGTHITQIFLHGTHITQIFIHGTHITYIFIYDTLHIYISRWNTLHSYFSMGDGTHSTQFSMEHTSLSYFSMEHTAHRVICCGNASACPSATWTACDEGLASSIGWLASLFHHPEQNIIIVSIVYIFFNNKEVVCLQWGVV